MYCVYQTKFFLLIKICIINICLIEFYSSYKIQIKADLADSVPNLADFWHLFSRYLFLVLATLVNMRILVAMGHGTVACRITNPYVWFFKSNDYRSVSWYCYFHDISYHPRSPELKPLDIFLRGYLKSIVYTDPAPETIQQLKDRIISAIQDIPVVM